MTSPIADSVFAWLESEGIDRASYLRVMRQWVSQAYGDGGANPIHALERGECTNEEFELALAAELVMLDGGPVQGTGLLDRMFARSRLDEAMVALLRQVRGAGVRTGLLSNSWGGSYPADVLAELFDAVVISAEVGMRKPEPRIFQHAAMVLGLAPAECVFIDDVEANVAAARQLGFTTVLHAEAAETGRRLAELLDPATGRR